jgi:hypothetical protein
VLADVSRPLLSIGEASGSYVCIRVRDCVRIYVRNLEKELYTYIHIYMQYTVTCFGACEGLIHPLYTCAWMSEIRASALVYPGVFKRTWDDCNMHKMSARIPA